MRVVNRQSVSRIRAYNDRGRRLPRLPGTRSPGVRCLRWNLKVQPRREVRSFRSSHPLHPSLLCAALPPLLVRLVLCHPLPSPPKLLAAGFKGTLERNPLSFASLCYSLSSSVGRSPRRDLYLVPNN